MSVTDTKKAPGALFENRNASEGVTDTEKSPGGLFPGVVCEHGTPIFGDCRECAIKRATERRKRYDRAKKAQEAAELCGRCGEDLLPDELVVVVGLGRITLGRWSVPVCAQCAHRKQWKLIYELRGYTYYSDGYYSYAEAPCTNCERLVAHQFLTKPRGKYHTESGCTVAQRLRHTASASLMHFPLVFKTVSDQADSVSFLLFRLSNRFPQPIT